MTALQVHDWCVEQGVEFCNEVMNEDLVAAIYEKVNVDDQRRSVKQHADRDVESQDVAQQDLQAIPCSQFDFFDCHGKFEFMDCVKKRDDCAEKKRQQERVADDISCQACRLMVPIIRNKTVLWLKALAKHKTASSGKKARKSGKEPDSSDALSLSNITRRDFLHLTNNMCSDHKTKSSWVNRVEIVGATFPYTLRMAGKPSDCDESCQTVTIACHNLLNRSRWSAVAESMLRALKEESMLFLSSPGSETASPSTFERFFCKGLCQNVSNSSQPAGQATSAKESPVANTSSFVDMLVVLRRGNQTINFADQQSPQDCCINVEEFLDPPICSKPPLPATAVWVEATPQSSFMLASTQKKAVVSDRKLTSHSWRRGLLAWGAQCKNKKCSSQGSEMRIEVYD